MDRRQNFHIPTWAIVLGFIFCWPVGLVLLFLSLGQAGSTAGTAQRTDAASSPRQRDRYSPSEPQAQGSARRSWKQPRPGTAMTTAGAVLSSVFGLALLGVLSDGLSAAAGWFPVLGLFLAGLFLLFKGVSATRLARRMKLYQGIVGQRSTIHLADLSAATGVSEQRLIADLRRMIADGYLPMGYVDRQRGLLVLSDQGYERPAAPKAPEVKKAPAPKAEAETDDAILRQIRQVNDAIPGEEMSRKIDRIEEITRKILDYQKKDPAKAPQLRQFLNYYLPTTLKILNAYARMDAQGIEGENISAAKARIEGMMDKVVEGFEKQLDQLFQADAMDIATDVDVLEKMLERDGLGSGGMTMGGGTPTR